jgi:hypothetical protein
MRVRARIVPGYVSAFAALLLLCCSEFVLYDVLSGAENPAEEPEEPEALALRPAVAAVLINGTVNFVGSGGDPDYVFSIVSGSGAIDAMTGVFTAPGATDTTVVQVEDAAGATDQSSVSVLAPTTLSIYPSGVTLPVNAEFQFSAAGGIPPFSFSKVSGVGTMSAAGLYDAGAGSGESTVRVADSSGAASDASITVVAAGVLGLNPLTPSIEEGKTQVFAGYGGSPPYSYSLSVSASGGSVNASTGRYTAGHSLGSGIDTIKVTDGAAATVQTTITVIPAAPSSLVADGSFGGPQDIRLTWTDNSSSETGFRVERKIGNAGVYGTAATVAPGTTSYDDLGLAPNTAYVYRVFAVAGLLVSPASAEAFDVSNP